MFEDMSDREFVDFLAAIWERRGWTTEVSEDDPGTYMITGDRENGARGLMLVVPDSEGSVAGSPVQGLVDICEAKNVDVGVVVTRGAFTDDARRIAEANDIFLVDPASLEETLREEGLAHVAEEFGSASIVDRLPIPTGVPAAVREASPPSIPTRALTTLLVAVGVAAAAIVGAQTFGLGIGALGPVPGVIPGFGEDPSEVTVTAASLTENGTGVTVAWNARTHSSVVTENGTRYDAPTGETFVVVQMNVTNDRDGPTVLRGGRFGFAANDTVRGPRTLQGREAQLPVRIDPGGSETLWFVFTIDADESSGTLLGLPSESGPPIRFEHDPSVDAGVGSG